MPRLLVAIGIVASALVACASDDPVEPTLKPTNFEEFAVSYAHFTCDALAPCCQADHVSYDERECREGQALRARLLFGGSSGLAFDPENAEARIAQGIQESEQCIVLEPAHGPCARVAHGERPLGSPCEHAIQCGEPEGQRVQCKDGQCALLEVVKQGDPCDGSCDEGSCQGLAEQPCQRALGLYCAAPDSTCAPLVPVGGSGCKSYDDLACVVGAFCDNAQDRCVAKGALGAPCASFSECDADHYCDGTQCLARVEPGQPCTDGVTGCRNGSCEKGVCRSRMNDVCH